VSRIVSEQMRGRQGPVAVLTLLFGLLVCLAGGTGLQLQPEPGNAQLRLGESLRGGTTLRLVRAGNEEPDSEDAHALLSAPPRIVTDVVSLRPALAVSSSASTVQPTHRHIPYQARAPPAL
jgi:hypothetical protein